MFERFTDRARMVYSNANSIALKTKEGTLYSRHLLMGVLKSQGVAANVLENLGVHATMELAKLEAWPIRAVEEGLCMGKLPQTPEVKKITEEAIRVAGEWQNNYVGTEHIFYALIAIGATQLCEGLKNITMEQWKREVFLVLDWNKAPKDPNAELVLQNHPTPPHLVITSQNVNLDPNSLPTPGTVFVGGMFDSPLFEIEWSFAELDKELTETNNALVAGWIVKGAAAERARILTLLETMKETASDVGKIWLKAAMGKIDVNMPQAKGEK